jgi:hypothetical protein
MALLAVAIVLRWLWSGAFLAEFHSDTADTLFWAEAQQDAGALANSTFHYGYFIPFGGNLLVRPFLPVVKTGLAALRSGMTLFVFLFAGVCYGLFRSFRWRRAESLLGVLFLLAVASASPKMREIHFGHVLYYSLGTVFLFLGCALAPDVPNGEKGDLPCRRRAFRQAAFACCMGWAVACGMPLLLYAVVPVFGAWVLLRLAGRARLSPLGDGLRLLPGLVGVVAGLALFLAVSRGVLFSKEYTTYYEAFSPLHTWFQTAQVLPQEWISLLDPLPKSRILIAGLDGLPHVMRIAAALFVGVAPVVALWRIRRFGPRERVLVVAHWILAAEILFYWVFGNISNANWRLCPVVLSGAAVSVCLVRNAIVRGFVPERRFAVCAGLFLAGFGVLSLYQTCRLPAHPEIWKGDGTLIPTLEAIGVRDGYCSDYWYANAITAVSDGRFRIREVRADSKGNWNPRLHNADERWYEPDPERTQTVFVCHPSEESRAPTRGLVGRHLCSQLTGRLGRSEPLVVLVYEGDVFNPES